MEEILLGDINDCHNCVMGKCKGFKWNIKSQNYLDELPSQDLKKPSFDTELPFIFSFMSKQQENPSL